MEIIRRFKTWLGSPETVTNFKYPVWQVAKDLEYEERIRYLESRNSFYNDRLLPLFADERTTGEVKFEKSELDTLLVEWEETTEIRLKPEDVFSLVEAQKYFLEEYPRMQKHMAFSFYSLSRAYNALRKILEIEDK